MRRQNATGNAGIDMQWFQAFWFSKVGRAVIGEVNQ